MCSGYTSYITSIFPKLREKEINSFFNKLTIKVYSQTA